MLKSEAINQAYAMIRISGLTTTAVPEEIHIALLELDQMMSVWRSLGRDIGYHFPEPTTDDTTELSDPNDVIGVYDWAEAGTVASLAKNLVEYYGKEVPANISRKSRFGVNAINQRTVKLDPQQYPRNMPIGSGNRFHYGGQYLQRFYFPVYKGRAHTTPITVEQNLDLIADFTNNLAAGDAVASYTIAPFGGVALAEHSQDNNLVRYRVVAEKNLDGSVQIVATTDNGLVIPKSYCFTTQENTCVVTLDG